MRWTLAQAFIVARCARACARYHVEPARGLNEGKTRKKIIMGAVAKLSVSQLHTENQNFTWISPATLLLGRLEPITMYVV